MSLSFHENLVLTFAVKLQGFDARLGRDLTAEEFAARCLDHADACLTETFKRAPKAELAANIQTLGFSVRVERCLALAGIKTLRDLTAWTPAALMGRRNFGDTCLREVEIKLARLGLRLLTP